MNNARESAKVMMRKALDRRTPEQERIQTAFKCLATIDKHGLLDSPLDFLPDKDLVQAADEGVRATKTVVNSVKKILESIPRPGGGRRRRRGDDD